jgi:putative CocE/NonD family hydrolase
MTTKLIARASALCLCLFVPLLWHCGQSAVLANRALLKAKADQSQGLPSIYNPPALSHHFKQLSRYVTLDDGTKIAVDIYLPQPLPEGQKLPVIYEQSRYWRVIRPRFPFNVIYSKPISVYRSEFLRHGYIWVVSDARGAGASFGERPWELPPLDVSDSGQILQWILHQPWCDGKIGLIGHSYSGNMAEFTLLNKNPAVKACAVLSSSFDLYADILRPGGLPLQPFIDQWTDLNRCFDNNSLPKNLKKLQAFVGKMKAVDEDRDGLMLKQAIKQHAFNSQVDTDKIVFRDDSAIGNGTNHSPTHERSMALLQSRFGDHFLKRGVDLSSPSGYFQDIDSARVPIYAGAGWLDGANSNAAVKRFLNYTTPGTKLILGPWDHDFINISPFTRGGFSRFSIEGEMLKFFDHYMKGLDSLSMDLPVHYYTLGEEQWHDSPTWPPDNTARVYYLHSGQSLTEKAPEIAEKTHYQIREDSATGHHGRWDCLTGNILLDPYPDRRVQDRKNLVFDTAALNGNITVSGNPALKLTVIPDAQDLSLFCYLEDVWPNGSVHYVTEGEVLAANRLDTEAKPMYKTVLPARSFLRSDYEPLVPGKPVEVDLELLPMSYQFKRGHHIRLSIAGRDRDHFRTPKLAATAKSFDILFGHTIKCELSLPVTPVPEISFPANAQKRATSLYRGRPSARPARP